MTRDDIIRMAREVCGQDMVCWQDGTEMEWGELERFAALVAAAAKTEEREECAKVSDYYADNSITAKNISTAIRTRRQS